MLNLLIQKSKTEYNRYRGLRLNLTYKVKVRQLRPTHAYAHFCSALYKYMRHQVSILLRDTGAIEVIILIL